MKLHNFNVAIVAFFASILFAGAVRAQTVDEIIAKHIAARGGEKITSLTSIRATGSLILNPQMTATLMQESKRPNLMRMDMTVGTTHAIRAYDGKTGWVFMPQNGEEKPRVMTADELKDALEEADFLGPLFDYKQKGHTVGLLGKEAVDGVDCYKLKVTLKGGEVRTHYIDAKTFLETRIEGTGKDDRTGEQSSFVQKLSDYKSVDGVMIPYMSVVEARVGNQQPQTYTFTVEKLELNPAIEDSHFAMYPNWVHDAPASQPAK